VKGSAVYSAVAGHRIQLKLELAVRLWPTPTARDYKDAGDLKNVPPNGYLGRVVGPSKEYGSLNPLWVEWLMGYPAGWTD
jgi:hypothetical protein